MTMRSAFRLDSATFTHDGGRDYNEDAVGDSDTHGSVKLFMLADGAGGQGGGDVAAKTAISAARAEFLRLPAYSTHTIQRCIAAADAAIRSKQSGDPRLSRMASTFVAALVDQMQMETILANLGDSRGYVFRGKQIIAQSYDHSLVQRFIDAGLYPADKLRAHPKRNVLYASLGANEEVIEPYVSPGPVALQDGDGILLCSDGVWELVDEAILARLHSMSTTVSDWRDVLVAAVRGRMAPGHDNFSALLIRCVAVALSNEDEQKTVPPQNNRRL
jgi:PPM family protein phosphatase